MILIDDGKVEISGEPVELLGELVLLVAYFKREFEDKIDIDGAINSEEARRLSLEYLDSRRYEDEPSTKA